jgi:glutaminyl-peptide cyclotransferase
MEEVASVVALGPRPSGSEGAARTAIHLAERLRAAGCTVETDAFEDATPTGPILFRNVIGRVAGSQPERIVLLSHYDTKAGISGDFVGANDSGSSTGLLLAMAPLLARRGPAGPELLLAFVDGEECQLTYSPRDGLHGSRRLAATLHTERREHPVSAVIVLDMIGDRDLTITIPRNSTSSLIQSAFAAATAEGARERFSLFPGEILDDHVPFLERGMPAIDLIDFHFGSAPGRNDYWHTDGDTLETLSPDSLQTMGRVVLHMLNAIPTRTTR